MLLYTTCQFFCREATRRACISDAKFYKWSVSINCIWMNLPLLFLVGNLMAFIWTNLLTLPDKNLIESYQLCVYLIIVSILIELLVEPFYIYGHLNDFIKSRVLIEGFTNLTRTFGMVLIVFNEKRPEEILAQFGHLHLLSSIGYSLAYYLVFFFHFETQSSTKDEVNKLGDFIPSFKNVSNSNFIQKLSKIAKIKFIFSLFNLV